MITLKTTKSGIFIHNLSDFVTNWQNLVSEYHKLHYKRTLVILISRDIFSRLTFFLIKNPEINYYNSSF